MPKIQTPALRPLAEFQSRSQGQNQTQEGEGKCQATQPQGRRERKPTQSRGQFGDHGAMNKGQNRART